MADLVAAWRERVTPAQGRIAFVGGTLVAFLAFLLARLGTPAARVAAGAVLVLPGMISIVVWRKDRAVWSSPSRTLEKLALPLDPELAGRAIRALGLLGHTEGSGTSAELAKLHVGRTLRDLPRTRILERAVVTATRYGRVTLLLAMLALGLAATRGFSIIEGIDVLVARHHHAPMPIMWLDPLDIEARAPEYLHEHDRDLAPYGPTAVPRGTQLTFRGAPLHPGRRLFLSDGKTEVPFVDDGSGHVVARWPVTETKPLVVLARFGEVTIGEPEPLTVMSIEDEVPKVSLEGAPREVRLAEIGAFGTIPVKYEATDDHGLREVHLVLRSGPREERRVLAHLNGETDTSRGGYALRSSDAFLKKSHAPVMVTVEAEDNDPITGPKWGQSAPISIIPPEAGEPEARRLDALRTLRDAFVDSLGARIDRSFAVPAPQRTPLAEQDESTVVADEAALDQAAGSWFAGISLSKRLVGLLRGQLRRVKEALHMELKSPGVASHGRLVAATERLVLVTDGVLRGLAQHDARGVARNLADVADDLVLGTSQMRRSEERDRGEIRAKASVTVLEGGGRSLVRLGGLGRDLGEIVHMDLLRVARARDQADLVHAEIAANDLATRLREPDPSFGAQGSSGGRAGGESGGGRGTPGEGEPSDDAEQAFDQAAGELGKLSSEHAEELGKVEQLMNDNEPDDAKEASEGAKSHARAIREATTPLPSVGAGSDSWTNKGAAAREHAEAMARALEQGDSAEALANGRNALDALEEAKHIAQRERWSLFSGVDPDADRSGAEKKLAAVRAKLEPEVAWAASKVEAQKKRSAQKKAGELAQHGDEEGKLAERAGSLGQPGDGARALPEAALDALEEAKRAAEEAAASLRKGDAEQGLAHQREAQRKLEAAREALGGQGSDEPGNGSPGEEGHSGHAEIPNATSHKGPDDFRRRVIDGLGQGGGGKQRDAIRRYADGLLR